MCRTELVASLDGGVARVVKDMLLTAFFNEDGHNLGASGITVRLHDDSRLVLFCGVAFIYGDEAALHYVYACKGAAGHKPCFQCLNVVNHHNDRGLMALDRSGTLVTHAETNDATFIWHTSDSLKHLLDKLATARATLGKTRFEDFTTSIGWSLNPHSVLHDPRAFALANCAEHAAFDWMHVYYVIGIFNTHAGLLTRLLKMQFGVLPSHIDAFVQRFRFPKRLKMKSLKVFSKDRAASTIENKTSKASASEGLTTMPVFSLFLDGLQQRSADAELRRHCECFLQLALVTSMLQRSVRGLTRPDDLRRAVRGHLATFQDLFGSDVMTPKFHYAQHLWQILDRFGVCPSCFTHERKHRAVKKFGDRIQNTSCSWDASVLRECTSSHLIALAGDDHVGFLPQPALVEPRKPARRLFASLQAAFGNHNKDDFSVASSAKISEFEMVSVDDVVLFAHEGRWRIGSIACLLHLAVADPLPLAIVNLWTVEADMARSWECKRSPDSMIARCSAISTALTWSDDHACCMLKPFHISEWR